MDLALITLEQVVILFILILAGFAIVKTGAVKAEGKKHFSDILLYLIVPAMVIHSYMTEFSPEILSNLMMTFGLSAAALLLGLLITIILTFKIKSKNLHILKFACVFPNAAYMGFPLIQALFGSEGLLYASAFVTMFNILLWTVGYGLMSGKIHIKEVLQSIFSTPVLISVVIGLIIYLCRIPVPTVIKQPLSFIGNMNTPLSMIITGMIIAESNFKKILANRQILYIIIIRMIIIPAACFGLFTLLNISGMAATVVLLLEACPTAAITSIFAVKFNHDEDFAAGAVVLTTFCSIITLPLYAMLLTMIL